VEEGSALILGSLRRAAALIAGFKQVSVDQSSDQRRRFHLHEFLQEVQLALRPSLRGTPHELHIVCAEGIEVDTFPGALFQILTNLLNNAQTHAFVEGQAGTMTLRAQVEEGCVLLSFADNGRGMDAATAARAFDPFFTTRRGSGGSGLGLHIVHNLVTQLLGGSIELRTAPGEGATFELRLPLQAPQRKEA
jgi:signal transduction histidine kinase